MGLGSNVRRFDPHGITSVQSKPELKLLWAEYKATGSKEIWEQLVIIYRPLVVGIAHHMVLSMPSSIEEDDLISCGMFGLFDAIEKFDLDLGWKFETYARVRIRGAIVDEMRSTDWVPRSVRGFARQIDLAESKLEAELLCTSHPVDVAEELQITLSRYFEIVAKVDRSKIVYIDGLERGEDVFVGDPVIAFKDEELKHVVWHLVGLLPERERSVVLLYYFGDLTLKEIGSLYSFTEAWASKVHKKAIKLLKAEIV